MLAIFNSCSLSREDFAHLQNLKYLYPRRNQAVTASIIKEASYCFSFHSKYKFISKICLQW